MPLQRRVPKFGFNNPSRVEYRVFNLSQLEQLIQSERLNASQTINPAVLVEAGLARSRDRIKILGQGTLTVPVMVQAHAFSRSALRKIEEADGTAEVLNN